MGHNQPIAAINLDEVIPVGAPWGGPESISFLSALTSFDMYCKHRDGSGLIYCCNGQGTCYGACTRCHTGRQERNHESQYHCLLAISGLGVLAPHNQALSCRHEELAEQMLPDYQDFILDFLGYRRARLEVSLGKEHLQRTIIESLRNGLPVLFENHLTGKWCVITGYNDAGDTLLGFDGKRELFKRADWYESCANLLVFERETRPERAVELAFIRMIAVLEDTASRAEDIAFAQSLLDTARFEIMGADELHDVYMYTAAVIGYYAESRCFTRNALCNALCGRCLYISHTPNQVGEDTLLLNAELLEAARFFQYSHDECSWGAWHTMNYQFKEPDGDTIQAFRKHETRAQVAQYLLAIAKNDRSALQALQWLPLESHN
ncbi:MAG: hypothetical protein LLG44_02085 [Chloroflexi bacterium]|nr:hypothetical protein [Chloroflexota bacterium]